MDDEPSPDRLPACLQHKDLWVAHAPTGRRALLRDAPPTLFFLKPARSDHWNRSEQNGFFKRAHSVIPVAPSLDLGKRAGLAYSPEHFGDCQLLGTCHKRLEDPLQ